MAQLRFGVAYDFRNPPDSGRSLPELYARCLEQIRSIDRLGYDAVWITEHHFVDDGYVPSFVAVAGAIAAATRRVAISSNVLLMPFAHPVRLAEDLAVLDNLSNGRMMLGVGLGYAHHEFRAFGVDRRHRVSLTEEGIEILRRAWSEDRFDFHGTRFRFEGVAVRPRPVQPGGPPLWIAAMSEAGARRAARLGAHLLPQGRRPVVLDPWYEELEARDRRREDYRVGILRPFVVTDDRAAIWPKIRAAERYRVAVYERWLREAGDQEVLQTTPEPNAIPQSYIVGGAQEVADEIAAFAERFGVTDLITWGAPPGVSPELMNDSLERFASDVMPHFR
jgi:alkanesulfonate monooxygenase SsuD/methylene tetrahydromethanopterin reductase-like flavin-dependent oxidoreductase (luciferase family)